MDDQSRRKRLGWRWLAGGGLVFVLLAILGGWWVTNQVLPYAIVGTNRLERTLHYGGVTPASLGLNGEAVGLRVAPDIALKGWFVRAQAAPKGTVLLLHGHNSCKEAELQLAKRLATHGFNSLCYDSRGCGESGGRFCTYGFYEKGDCSRYLDELLRRYGETVVGPVSIYGNSFGGAVALQVMAQDRRFRCGIVESTFATLREVVRDYEKNLVGVRLDPLTDRALARGGVLAHFPPDLVRPEESAKAIRCPVLVVHGTADTDISSRYGERIFRNLSSAGSQWFPVPGAGHTDLWTRGGDAYEQAFLNFLEAHGR